ncbi:hypothetical protein HELRODRAFT_76463 [Helobdella robusta]|uniref:ubiquitinyl hydrolase 1 n=1 Tax=Helobdella robusta TaxID=6412 RepID=T1G2K2_HELRO|nr:hypothetical protein HELRODRAFT_76463 [Helobdella robusta]ESO07362.1 hypothetical protein HELRODRAFT_76463 [Helobdella robusta]
MWGFHDRVLALRRAVNCMMTTSNHHIKSFRRRWQHQQATILHSSCGLILDDEEWDKEWEFLVRVSSLTPRFLGEDCLGAGTEAGAPPNPSTSSIYESLDEFHVFVLAHVIKRPILVVADPFLHDCEGMALSPVPFRGVYLPLERSPEDCCPSLLLLAYNLGHFCALVPTESKLLSENFECWCFCFACMYVCVIVSTFIYLSGL